LFLSVISSIQSSQILASGSTRVATSPLRLYQNPNDRRFHAQPNACSNCGPQLQLTNSKGQDIATDKIITKTATLLKQGNDDFDCQKSAPRVYQTAAIINNVAESKAT
jgi:hypothetical protein